MENKLDLSQELSGRRALVTGGTRGIGLAIAQRLIDTGAKVVVSARTPGDALPKGAHFVAGDVATVAGAKAIAKGTLEALGGLDILVNNAGGATGFPQGSATIPDEEWEACLALNLLAAVRLTNALLPALRESKVASVVNLSSGAARLPIAAVAHYCAAKAALESYSRTLALELAPTGIRVNVVSPGPVTTPGNIAFHQSLGAPPDLFAKDVPLGRYGTTEDVAEVVALLVSQRGKWLTGGNIDVDGGMNPR